MGPDGSCMEVTSIIQSKTHLGYGGSEEYHCCVSVVD